VTQFAPKNALTEQIPCTHFPLSSGGQTIESLHRIGTEQEIEEALGAWLRATIGRLEGETAKPAALAD
jgi:hypothetical protein